MEREVWSVKSAVCSVRCRVSREGYDRDKVFLNYRSFIFGKFPPPIYPGLCCKFNLNNIYIFLYLLLIYNLFIYIFFNKQKKIIYLFIF